jgi:phosphohistidine phosphatase
MNLYLIQHGEAKSREEDPERPLSDKGAEDVNKTARAVSSVSVERIFHSGKLRAGQTARIFGEALGKDIAGADSLSPMDDPSVWASRLKDEEKDTMLVGHMPHMAGLASLLLCGDPEAGVVEFRMGGVVCLKKEEGRWSLQWMIVPEMV